MDGLKGQSLVKLVSMDNWIGYRIRFEYGFQDLGFRVDQEFWMLSFSSLGYRIVDSTKMAIKHKRLKHIRQTPALTRRRAYRFDERIIKYSDA